MAHILLQNIDILTNSLKMVISISAYNFEFKSAKPLMVINNTKNVS